MSIRFISAAALVFVAGSAALAQVEDAAKAKLQAMADAVKGANAITYSSVNKGSGGFFSMIPEHRADIAMLRDPATKQWKIRYSGSRIASGTQPGLDFIVVSDGVNRTWINDAEKTVVQRPIWNSDNVEQVTAAQQPAIREFSVANPFERDLGAETIRQEGQVAVNGVLCDVVLVDPGQQQPQYRYFIAATDNLPRKVEQILGEMGTQAWTLSNVQLNPPISENLFKVDVPTGYKFIPAAPPPAPVPNAAAPVAPAGPKARTVGPEIDNLAPDFTLTSGDGKSINLAQERGNVVVLDFWGTWCLPCKKASPGLQKLHEKYKDDPVKIYGLAVREANDDNPRNYMKEGGYTYGLLLKADDVAKDYRVRLFPTYVVIGKEGQISHISAGFTDTSMAELEDAIEVALGRKEPAPKPAPAPAAEPAKETTPAGDAPAQEEAGEPAKREQKADPSRGSGGRGVKREPPKRK